MTVSTICIFWDILWGWWGSLWPDNQEWHWTVFAILAMFKFSSLKWNCECLQFCCEIYLSISWRRTICCVGAAASSFGRRLHRHLYSPVPTHFPPTGNCLAKGTPPLKINVFFRALPKFPPPPPPSPSFGQLVHLFRPSKINIYIVFFNSGKGLPPPHSGNARKKTFFS